MEEEMITEMIMDGELNEAERRLIAKWIEHKFIPVKVIAWSTED